MSSAYPERCFLKQSMGGPSPHYVTTANNNPALGGQPYLRDDLHTAELARLYEVISDLSSAPTQDLRDMACAKHVATIAKARACKQTGELVGEPQQTETNRSDVWRDM